MDFLNESLNLLPIEAVSCEEMEAIENKAYFSGVKPFELMERAGKKVAEYILDNYPASKILILIASGNNGGDGLIAGKYLHLRSRQVTIIKLSSQPMKSQEGKKAQTQVEEIQAIKMYKLNSTNITTPEEKKDEEVISLKSYKKLLNSSDLILDAIFGMKLRTKVREPINQYIAELGKIFPFVNKNENKKEGKVLVALDLPSGLDSNSGQWLSEEFLPNIVLAIQYCKLGVKKLRLSTETLDIGLHTKANWISHYSYYLTFMKTRDPFSHKGQNGRLMIVGGSDEYTGAPVLATKAALRTGVDTVRTIVPESIRDIVAGYSEDFLIGTAEGSYFHSKQADYFAKFAINRHTCVAIGMGTSNKPEVQKFIRRFVAQTKKKISLVIDADGIRSFGNFLDILQGSGVILTPHRAEIRDLLNEEIPIGGQALISFLEQKAKKLGVIFVLKGKIDIITNGTRTFLNKTGHSGMTVGGTGDVLSGVIAAFACFIKDKFFASVIGAYIMGIAGEIAAQKYGNSLLATDIIKNIPQVLLELEEKRKTLQKLIT